MPRRKSLTRRFLHHLLLLSLARTILTVLGRGRAWDEWDERNVQDEPQPAKPRSFQRRFGHTLSFALLFVAGLALSAGAGNEVRSLLEDDTAPVTASGTGATGPTGPTGPTATAGQLRVAAQERAASELRVRAVVAPTAPRTAAQSSRPSREASLRAAAPAAAPKRATGSRTRLARPSLGRPRPHATRPHRAPKKHRQAPQAPPLDPETQNASGVTVWLNRAAPDPTPPAARLRLSFARELVAYSRQAHVDWALVLAVLRADGHNGRVPAGSAALRRLAFTLSGLGGRHNAWAAALAYSSDTSLADRVVALRHYYRAVGLVSLVHGLLSQKADLQDRVLHDKRLQIYGGGRSDVRAGHVDVRVLALMLYLAQTYRQVTVSSLVSGHRLYARPGVVSAHVYGRAIDIATVGGTSITGHQQPGGITEQAVRSILMLPGGMLPRQVISLLGLGGPSFPLANHYDHIHVGY
jgi:hypothetical protein